MTRWLLGFIAGFAASISTAFAQNALSVRSGEHDSYSRLVIQASDWEWELRQSGRRATLRMAGWKSGFDTSGVFDRIPRTRLLSLKSDDLPGGSVLELNLACDCEVRASMEGAYIVLDVVDPTEPTDETVTERPKKAAQADSEEPQPPRSRPVTPEPSVDPDPPPPDDDTKLASTPPSQDRLAEWLAQRLETAAARGLVDLDDEVGSPSEGRPAAPPEMDEAHTEQVEAAGSPGEPAVPASRLEPQTRDLDDLERLTEQLNQSLGGLGNEGEADQSVRISIPEAVPVEDQAAVVVEKDDAPQTGLDPEHCVADHHLRFDNWIQPGSIVRQISDLRRDLLHEFDTPDPRVALDLIHIYLANGMGLEAKSVVESLAPDFEQRDLLLELAEVVEGQPYRPEGVLQHAIGCQGRIALWRTIAVDRGEALPVDEVQQIIGYFSDLPIETRRIVGPRLSRSLLNRTQIEAAKRVFALVERAPGAHGAEHELMRARIHELDGRFEPAKQVYAELIVGNSPVAAEAMVRLVEGMLGRGEVIDAELLEQLETEAFRNRHLPTGEVLRILEIKARADAQSLHGALDVVDRMVASTTPERAGYFLAAASSLLAKVEPKSEAEGEYVRAIFDFWHIASGPSIKSAAKNHVASKLLEAGLPNAALAMLSTIEEAETAKIAALRAKSLYSLRLLDDALAEAEVARDQAGLRARIQSAQENHRSALEAVMQISDDQDVTQYAWRAGSWSHARKSDDRAIALLADFMADRLDLAETQITGVDGVASDEVSETGEGPGDISVTLRQSNDVYDQSNSARALIQDAISRF